ncbi:hypothetical protein DL769_011021 [Monosporascus sp. CRB-8-3]|nr:hypothetical protein DL769_011021 [Monosporascus sp. CRB-8-3]
MPRSLPREELLQLLRGQVLEIPDLHAIFKHWPQAVNPRLDRLRPLIPKRLLELTESSKELARLNKADFGLFSAAWWPMATLEAADILACLLFLWDDGERVELR